ncbi:hypothetical protein O181_015684 [Austropuccinia psidii MF-1]|uniref:Uncharacterized protein n=1 Tax=Austropuccinia psidii MF-1 TaxID=1389203 RepID=A0A9Q3C2G1_9BASI|nr:hypothetical protein [Austropuccinia psidii MF-1]
MLTLPQCPQDMPLWWRPHPRCTLTPPYDSSRSCHALQTCLQRGPHTGLILNTSYHPYAPAFPSRYASNTAITPPYASAPHSLTR